MCRLSVLVLRLFQSAALLGSRARRVIGSRTAIALMAAAADLVPNANVQGTEMPGTPRSASSLSMYTELLQSLSPRGVKSTAAPVSSHWLMVCTPESGEWKKYSMSTGATSMWPLTRVYSAASNSGLWDRNAGPSQSAGMAGSLWLIAEHGNEDYPESDRDQAADGAGCFSPVPRLNLTVTSKGGEHDKGAEKDSGSKRGSIHVLLRQLSVRSWPRDSTTAPGTDGGAESSVSGSTPLNSARDTEVACDAANPVEDVCNKPPTSGGSARKLMRKMSLGAWRDSRCPSTESCKSSRSIEPSNEEALPDPQAARRGMVNSFSKSMASFSKSFSAPNDEKVAPPGNGRRRRNTGGYHPKVDDELEALAGPGGYEHM